MFLTVKESLIVNAAKKDLRYGKILSAARVREILQTLSSHLEEREKFVTLARRVFEDRKKNGRKLNSDQLEVLKLVDPAAAVVYKVMIEEKSAAKSTADRVASFVARHSFVARRPSDDLDRRKKLEADPEAWLRWYLAAAYTRPFDAPHKDIIYGAITAQLNGDRFVVAAERGIGKSSLFYGLVLLFKLSGRCLFPVYLPWSAPVMKRGLQFWKSSLSFNARLVTDYPEYCAPFAHAKGVAQRLDALKWEDTYEPCGALLQVSDGMIVFPDQLGVIGGSSVNGNPRGLNFPQKDGSIIRPDLALIDDPQNRKISKSATLVSETCAKIDQDIAGLGSAGADFPMLMSGNCIITDDVMDLFLKDKNWRTLRVSCIERWPNDWEDNGRAYKMWTNWWDLYRTDQTAAAKYYSDHAAAMTEGMKLSAPNAYQARVSDVLPDAFCVAMRQYWHMGHTAFMAERQQRPVCAEEMAPFSISPKVICSRTDASRKAFAVPESCSAIKVMGTDINHYGLHSAFASVGNDSTAALVWYGCYEEQTVPRNASEGQRKAIIFSMLTAHGRQIKACPVRPDCWIIDGGYEIETVMRYVREGEGREMPFRIYVARGFSDDRYKPFGKWVIGTPRDHCHLTEWPSGRGIAFSADYYREIMQRAWLSEIGQPGGISLFAGEHRAFAEQICRERLREKIQGSTGTFYKWDTAPGRHDYGDALTMCYVGAAFERGISPGSSCSPAPAEQTGRRRRVSVIRI